MRFRTSIVLTFCIVVALAGISALDAAEKGSKDKTDDTPKEPKTIGMIASVDGLNSFPAQGVALIVGFDDTGSDPPAGPERSQILDEMRKRGVKNAEEWLKSPQTALVRIRASIPPAVRSCRTAGCWCKDGQKPRPGATAKEDGFETSTRPHKGDAFDVEVELLERDTAKSIEGGWLLDAWLYEVAAIRGAGLIPGFVRAHAAGPVMIAPRSGDKLNPSDLRQGRVLGGGVATTDRELGLRVSNDRSARFTIQIAARITERFQGRTRGSKPFAEPKDGKLVVLRIPPQYRQNVARFLEVVASMPLASSDADSADRLAKLETDLNSPATTRVSAVRLEGVGKRAVDMLKTALKSDSPDVRFFAAEALAYMDEPAAAQVLAETAREMPAYRAHALTALCSLDEAISRLKLRELFATGDSVELRFGAFRALQALDEDDPTIPEQVIDDSVHLHRIESKGEPFVHVARTGRPEIALFGKEITLKPPLLLTAGRNVIVKAGANDTEAVISYFSPGEPLRQGKSPLEVGELIRRTLNAGATYPDVLAMLETAEKNHNLPARLEMDAYPDPARLVERLRSLQPKQEAPPDNIAMSNLFGWHDSKKVVSRRSDDDDVASADAKPKQYLSKPSLWDRLMRRSAN